MKRLFLLAVCVALCLCGVVSAQAGGNASLILESNTLSAYGGDEITISVRMTADNMGGLQTSLTWDPDYATYVEGSAAFSGAFKANAMIAQANAREGALSLLYASTKGYTAQDEAVFTAKFRLAEDVNGYASFTLDGTKMTDASASVNAMSVSVQDVSVYTQVYHPGEAYVALYSDQQWPVVGDVVTVRTEVWGNYAKIGSVQGTVTYDPSVLELVKDSVKFTDAASEAAYTKSLNTSAEGTIRFVYAAMDGMPTSELLEMQFKVVGTQYTGVTLSNVKVTNAETDRLTAMTCWPQDVWIYPQIDYGQAVYTLQVAPGVSCGDDILTLQLTEHGAPIGGMQGTLTYDTAQMEYIAGSAEFVDSFAAGADIKMINDTKVGQIKMVYANTQGYSPNGAAILTLQFRLKAQENLTPVVLTNLKTTTPSSNGVQEVASSFVQGINWADGLHTIVVDKAVAATCTTAGKTQGKHCSVCNTVITAQTTIPAKGHTEVVDEAVAATCTTAGKTQGKHCSVCNTVLTAQTEIPAKGHTWDAGVVTRKPTMTAEGVLTYTCVACKTTKTERIPIRVPGDANSDGKVDLNDALLVFEYGSGKNVSINLYNADVNQDGRVDAQDALLIMQYVSGWDVKLK